MSITGLDHVLVSAPPGCEAEARRFYGGLLGLAEVPVPASLRRDGVWFACGEQQLHVGAYPDHAPAPKAHPAFRVDEEEALRALGERLEAAGAEVRWDDRLPVPRFYTDDPWGNRLEVIAGGAPRGGRAS